MGNTYLHAAAALLVIALAVLLADAAPLVKLNPPIPLLDVPFDATVPRLADTSLYISASATECKTSAAVGAMVCTTGSSLAVSQNTCRFTVKASALMKTPEDGSSAPVLYWCMGGSGGVPVGPLKVERIRVIPGYVIRDTPTTMHFNEVTPVGTKVSFFPAPSCAGASVADKVVTNEHAALVSLKGEYSYMCTSVKSVAGWTDYFITRIIYVASAYDLITTTGLRYTTVTVKTNSVPLAGASLSLSRYCEPLSQPPVDMGTGSGTNAILLPVSVPRGDYYYCGAIYSTSNGYLAANQMFHVTEYGLEPNVMFSGMQTGITLTLDAAVPGTVFEAALFQDKGHSSAPVVDWLTPDDWVVPVEGTYYAFVREKQHPTDRTALAATVTVSAPPTVSISEPHVKGMMQSVRVKRVGDDTYTVGVAETEDCQLLSNSTTSLTSDTATVWIPYDAPDKLYLCVSTPHRFARALALNRAVEVVPPPERAPKPYSYPFEGFAAKPYRLKYNPLQVNKVETITLDPDVSVSVGSSMKLMPASEGCAATLGSDNNNFFQLPQPPVSITPVLFPTAGDWYLCLRDPEVTKGEYFPLRKLEVFGQATLQPAGIVTGLSQEVTVSAIPSAADLFFTESPSCTGARLFPARAVGGIAKPTVTYNRQGALTLCVEYKGEGDNNEHPKSIRPAGTLPSAPTTVFPSVAFPSARNRLSFRVPDAKLLVGRTAYLMNQSGKCLGTPPLGSSQIGIQPGPAPYVEYVPATSMIGTIFTVCVGLSGNFVAAGTVEVVEPIEMTLTPPYAVGGMPLQVAFTGHGFTALKSNVFVVIGSEGSCRRNIDDTMQYASGSINSDGQTSIFLPPDLPAVKKLLMCVGNTDMLQGGLGYVSAGVIPLYPFTSLSHFALMDRPNSLKSWPLVGGSSLFLTPCSGDACQPVKATATCRSATVPKKFYTSPDLPLKDARPGVYVLCQEVPKEKAVVGANTTVQVVPAWSIKILSPRPVRQHAPVKIELDGGTGEFKGYTLTVQPATVACGEASEQAQEVQLTALTESFTITKVEPYADINFCLSPGTKESFLVHSDTLDYYMSPATIVAGIDNTITSAMVQDRGYARIAKDESCGNSISGQAAAISDYKSTLTVESCGANAKIEVGYYCESNDGVKFTSRGKMGILRTAACPGGAEASIHDVLHAPAAAMTDFGINTTFLEKPFLSKSHDCRLDLQEAEAGVYTKGYTPALDERAVFFVCCNPIRDPSFRFTTDQPTFTVDNWQVKPTTVLSRFNATEGVLQTTRLISTYRMPSQSTFISTTKSCDHVIASAADLSGPSNSTALSTTSLNGIIFICTASSTTGKQTAVADFLSVTPPEVTRRDMAIIKGAPFRATLVVQSFAGRERLYSMVPGEDASFTYAKYFVYNTREVFLSGDQCASLLAGTEKAFVVPSSNVVTLETRNINSESGSLSLCTGTPAGVANAAPAVPVSSSVLFPDRFVTGTTSTIYIPLSPSQVLQLSHSHNDCSNIRPLPDIHINEDGLGTVVLTYADGRPAELGFFTLCYQGTRSALTPLASISVTPQTYYDVRGLTYLVGVPSRMLLLQDLDSDHLLSGFSTSPDCLVPEETLGTWSTDTGTKWITVAAKKPNGKLYLCADTLVNHTRVALPHPPSFIDFITPSFVLPDTMNTCDRVVIDNCHLNSERQPNRGEVAVIYGDCCDQTARDTVLASSLMESGTCQLDIDAKKVKGNSSNDTVSVCMWDRDNENFCVTLHTVTIEESCVPSRAVVADGGLSRGALIGIIIGSILFALLLLLLLILLICCCCCKKQREDNSKARHLVALRQMEESEYKYPPQYHQLGPDFLTSTNRMGSIPMAYYPCRDSQMHMGGVDADTQVEMESSSTGQIYISSYSSSTPPEAITQQALLQNTEEDERDQIALLETRERYHKRVSFSDELERIMADEKGDDLQFDNEVNPFAGYPRHRGSLRSGPDPISSLIDHKARPYRDVDGDDNFGAPPGGKAPQREVVSVYSLESPASSDSPADVEKDHPNGARHRDSKSPTYVDVFADTAPSRSVTPENVAPQMPFGEQAFPVFEQAHVEPFNAAAPDAKKSAVFSRDIPVVFDAPAWRSDDDDDDMNELSYTTTQRFYDETRVLLEMEEARRRRLCNWEEEERGALAQYRLDHCTPDAHPDPVLGAVEEELYDAPRIPAALPRLPQRPLSNGSPE